MTARRGFRTMLMTSADAARLSGITVGSRRWGDPTGRDIRQIGRYRRGDLLPRGRPLERELAQALKTKTPRQRATASNGGARW
jgi:hypothetical protein